MGVYRSAFVNVKWHKQNLKGKSVQLKPDYVLSATKSTQLVADFVKSSIKSVQLKPNYVPSANKSTQLAADFVKSTVKSVQLASNFVKAGTKSV